MRLEFSSIFYKDLDNIPGRVASKVLDFVEFIENSSEINEVLERYKANIKFLARKDNLKFYRYRIGDYRLGLTYEDNEQVIELKLIRHRRKIYKRFP